MQKFYTIYMFYTAQQKVLQINLHILRQRRQYFRQKLFLSREDAGHQENARLRAAIRKRTANCLVALE